MEALKVCAEYELKRRFVNSRKYIDVYDIWERRYYCGALNRMYAFPVMCYEWMITEDKDTEDIIYAMYA